LKPLEPMAHRCEGFRELLSHCVAWLVVKIMACGEILLLASSFSLPDLKLEECRRLNTGWQSETAAPR
jgi:hypothetical protein